MEINKEFLQAVIHKIAAQKHIFSNESQFCLDGPKEKGTYKWNHTATSHDRVEDIKLNKKYDLHWLEYPHHCIVLNEKYEYPVRYLIEEV